MTTTASSCLTEESSADVIIQIAKPVLEQKKLYLITKRAFDIVCSFLGLLILAIPMIIIALTYSKTFILLLGLYWLLCLFYLIRGKRYLLAFIYIFATAFLAVILSDTLFATTLYRLTSASSVRELTTGRSILLEMYGREIISSPDILLFGNGMSAQLLKKGTHNLFLEIQYYVGLTGLILYLLYFGILTAQVQKKYAAGNAAARLCSLQISP